MHCLGGERSAYRWRLLMMLGCAHLFLFFAQAWKNSASNYAKEEKQTFQLFSSVHSRSKFNEKNLRSRWMSARQTGDERWRMQKNFDEKFIKRAPSVLQPCWDAFAMHRGERWTSDDLHEFYDDWWCCRREVNPRSHKAGVWSAAVNDNVRWFHGRIARSLVRNLDCETHGQTQLWFKVDVFKLESFWCPKVNRLKCLQFKIEKFQNSLE